MEWSLRFLRYVLLATLLSLLIAAVGMAVAIVISPHKDQASFWGRLDSVRCGVEFSGWIPIPHCAMRATPKSDPLLSHFLIMTGTVGSILVVVLIIVLFIRYERRMKLQVASDQSAPLPDSLLQRDKESQPMLPPVPAEQALLAGPSGKP
jgi:hypothetical protein